MTITTGRPVREHTAPPAFQPVPDEILVGGQWVTGRGGGSEIINPATGAVLQTVSHATVDDVDAAVAAGHRAAEAPSWRISSPTSARGS
ncbi:hypothetical protein MTP03_17070 [Tsukamurella sp. PLM1]|nr:hypothetical protein MTP03_17070 [Tsukamurella sp. PLM1]